jgi:O-antigen ligase
MAKKSIKESFKRKKKMRKLINGKARSGENIQAYHVNRRTYNALLIIAFILPWPHGGEIMWQYLIFCISIFSLCVIYFVNSNNNQKNINNNSLVFKSVKTPLILLGIWLLFQIFQAIPLPPYLTYGLSNIVENKLTSNNWQTISIALNVTLIEIIKHASYITVFILTLLLVNTKQRILNLANTLFFSSAIIALYSLINHYSHGAFSIINSIPPWTIAWEKSTHGTFSYQNHYASFLTLTIPLAYGLIYSKTKKKPNYKINAYNVTKVIGLIMSINGLYVVCCFLMIITLFKTASRGGNTIFIVSITITYLCVLFQQKKSINEKLTKIGLLIISVLVISVLVLTFGLSDSLNKRLKEQGYTPNGRDLMHKTTLAIIQERPLVGTGAGTYPILQHKYKSPLLGNTSMSKRAHNDYLELLSNQGIIGFTLLASAIFLLFIRLLQGLKKIKNKTNINNKLYGLQVACFCSVLAIILHSIVDFNFHLPVNTIYFLLIFAIGIKIPQLYYCKGKK